MSKGGSRKSSSISDGYNPESELSTPSIDPRKTGDTVKDFYLDFDSVTEKEDRSKLFKILQTLSYSII